MMRDLRERLTAWWTNIRSGWEMKESPLTGIPIWTMTPKQLNQLLILEEERERP